MRVAELYRWAMVAALLLAASAWPAPGQLPDAVNACRQADRHGKKSEAQECYLKLAGSRDSYLRAEGLWGMHRYKEANDQFQALDKANPKNADYKVRWGRFFTERFNPGDAAKLMEEALELKPNYPPALLGLAFVAAEDFEKKAVELAEQAVKLDPKLVEARELLSKLALEDNNEPKAIEEADKALAISSEALDAMAVRASIDWLNNKTGSPWISRIQKINPVYAEAWAMGGHFFVLNRRYEEGIVLYRKAVELDPQLWDARAELGINLMRLGEDAEARQHLEMCFKNGFDSKPVVNTLNLMDSYKNFLTFKTENTVLRLHKKEAELLRPYFESELKRALATYEKKYKLHLTRPVQVEVYPDHDDFAVRTMGMPGLGALGVTFGYVVAMDSPSGRKPGSFHWASTMWHELSHVYVLTATNFRVPRWFTEGMAVYEETAVSAEWGDRLDPDAILAIKNKKLLPVAELDRGFVRPSYPAQVVVSYFQAGRICSYIAGKWGYNKLLEMMYDFAKSKTTPEVIEQQLGTKPEEFDKQFLAWLEAQNKKTVESFDEWKKKIKVVAENARAKKFDDVIRDGLAILDLYPDYVEGASVYEFLVDAYLEKGDKKAARDQLERYAKVGGRSPMLLKKLSQLEDEAGNKKEAAAALERVNYVFLEDEDQHHRLGDLLVGLNNPQGAIREFEAVVAMHPIDQAGSHFNLAKAYRMAQQIPAAKEQLLLALEAAPGFKPAQKMLLELSQ